MITRLLSPRAPNVASIAKSGLLVFIASLSVLLILSPSQAQTTTPIISNLDQPYAGLTSFNTPSDRYAQSFVTSGASLNQFLYARLNMALQSTASAGDVLHLYLYNNGSGSTPAGTNSSQPTSQFVDLGTATVNSTTAGIYTFSSSSRYSLTASTTYWLVLQDDASSNAGWGYTTSSSYTGPGSVNPNAATGSSPDAGSSWIISATTYTDPKTGAATPYGAQLFEFGTSSASLMPEPDALLLLACGIVSGFMFSALRGRNRRGANAHRATRAL